MNRMFKLGLGLSAAAVLAVGCTTPDSTTNSTSSSDNATSSVSASDTAKSVDLDSDIANREAKGDLATYGGARRLTGDQTQFMRDAISQSGAKNVILLIGDGMGDSEITVARNYAEGAGGFFKGIDALPVTGQYTHYSLDKDGKPNYVTDSAASGTAWATGTKTYNGAISVDIKGEAHETLLEKAKKKGMKTGNVSTAEIEDATPAVQTAHVAARKCYGPEDAEKCGDDLKAKGGKGSIPSRLSIPVPISPSVAAPRPSIRRPRRARRFSTSPRRAATSFPPPPPSSTRSRRPTRISRFSASSPRATCRSAGRARKPRSTVTFRSPLPAPITRSAPQTSRLSPP